MKSKLFAAILLTLAGAVYAQQPAAQTAAAEQEIRGLEKKFNDTYAANDLPDYFAFYAPDFIQFLPEGRTDLPAYRKEWTAYIASGNRIAAAEISDLRVQIGPSQDTAVASYLLHVRTRTAQGPVTDEDFQETDVFFKRAGAWKIVHLHYSPAPKKEAK
ncbi:MAG: nuclear transport factor 2 family protein [Acidobacteriia bacterium]|nr:nuclear transport factor 2 family protein [Terriglobia bacterium]